MSSRLMKIENGILRLNAAVFALYGLCFLLAPVWMSQWLTGAAPGTPSGLIDMRATYGGMSLAFGLVLLLLASRQDLANIGLGAVLVMMLGMAGGRVLGMVLDGAANALMYGYLVLELGMAALAGLLILRARTRAT